MKKSLFIFVLILTLGSLAFGQLPVSIPKGMTASTGDTLTVPISVGNLTGQNVTGYVLTLTFDPAVLRPITFDTTGTRTTKPIPSALLLLMEGTDSLSVGKYFFVVAGTDYLTGSGLLINIKCLVLSGSNTSRSPLQLSRFIFEEGVPAAVVSNGSFGRPYEPTLVYPANTENVPSTTIAFRWNLTTGAETYRLQVSTNSGFTSLFHSDSTVTDTSKSVPGLTTGSTYYWRVLGKNAAGYSGYSATRSVTIAAGPPPVPTLTSPSNDTTDISLTPTLMWEVSPNATSYRLQVSTLSAFSTTVFDDSTLTGTSQPLSGLIKGTKYFWRVRAKGTNGNSNYSAAYNFTTIFPGPPTPTLVSPADSAVDVSLTPTLIWNASTGALKYRIQVSSSATFASTLLDDSTVTATQRSVSGLANNTVYYWRVSANNAEGWSANSKSRQFRTMPLAPGSAPTLSSPENGAMGIPIEPVTLTWTAVPTAARYHLQMSISDAFIANFVDDTSITSTSTDVMGLANNQIYYWRVAARNAAGEGPFSTSWLFKAGLATPVLQSPADAAVNQPIRLTFAWNVVTLAASYRIEIATNSNFQNIVVSDTTDTCTIVVSDLQISTTYYWRVKGMNEEGEGNYSDVRHFTTGTTGIEQLSQTIPTEFNLSQNYPNPFNPTTKVEFRIPKQTHVSVELYNILGNRIATLVNEVKSPGTYSVTIDGSTLASGMYFYTMKADNFTMSKKLVLMK